MDLRAGSGAVFGWHHPTLALLWHRGGCAGHPEHPCQAPTPPHPPARLGSSVGSCSASPGLVESQGRDPAPCAARRAKLALLAPTSSSSSSLLPALPAWSHPGEPEEFWNSGLSRSGCREPRVMPGFAVLSTALQPGLMDTAGTDTPWTRSWGLWVLSGAPL